MADFQEALKQSETNARPTQTGATATTAPQGISTGIFTGLQMYPAGAGATNVPPSSTAAPVVTPAPPQALGSGSAVNSNGGVSYTAADNKFLQSGPTGLDLSGNLVAVNPNYYATPEAAAQFAKAFGGTVVQDPNCKSTAGSTQWAVRLPNQATVNAGTIAQILGNDAAYPNDRSKSAALATAFGLPWKGENFAACARSGDSIANAGAAPVPNPAALQGDELAYYQAHPPSLT